MKLKISVSLITLITGMGFAQTNVYAPVTMHGYYILTPEEAEIPRINGPSVFGVRPGAPFLYSIPATGRRPLTFRADNLPKGLTLDESTGIISGSITDPARRKYALKLYADNEAGTTMEKFTITVGNTISLTPPMGWTSRNCLGANITQERVIAAAEAMLDKGLNNHGWSYINMDDGWQGLRGGKYNAIQADTGRFTDMRQLCDDIHAMGLKVGLYSSPWITTHTGFAGGSSDNLTGDWGPDMGYEASSTVQQGLQRTGRHTWEKEDAAQWADWGIDFLKYEWHPNDIQNAMRMGNVLKNSGRDIVYSIAHSADVSQAQRYASAANCWRTTADLEDRWDEEGSKLSIREVWQLHEEWMNKGVKGSPGKFPDADILAVGDTVNSEGQFRPSRLTADEQYSQVSLWTLWSSPLLISCPIESLDRFTEKLLTNAEVIDIHQDSAVKPARSISRTSDQEIYVKDLADPKSKAVGLFNLDDESRIIVLNLKAAKMSGTYKLRDVWRQRDIGTYKGQFSAEVPGHGVILLHATLEPDKKNATNNTSSATNEVSL